MMRPEAPAKPVAVETPWWSRLMIGLLTGGSLIMLPGCWVMVMSLDTPEAPRPRAYPALADKRICFELDRPGIGTGVNKSKEFSINTIREVLREELGAEAAYSAPPCGSRYLYFHVLEWQRSSKMPPLSHLSLVLSLLTFSVIPGYTVETYPVDIRFEARDADGRVTQAVFSYARRESAFIWLPLIVYPGSTVAPWSQAFWEPYERSSKEASQRIIRQFLHDANKRLVQPVSTE